MTSILQDLLTPGLLEEDPKVIIQQYTNLLLDRAVSPSYSVSKSTTHGKAKSLLEFHDLVRQAIDDYEKRAGVPVTDGKILDQDRRIVFTEEEPDARTETESITFSLMRREPGGFGQGAPFESNVKNLRPIVRDIVDDPRNPGYRIVVLGYWHDNIVRYTCWARTNKAANARAMWFDGMMEDYNWWFALQGVSRIIYWGQGPDITTNIDSNSWYGRPIDYFVKTETLRTFSEKTLEEVLVRLAVEK
jgi:hypothetical protein